MNKLILSLILSAALLGCLFLAHWLDGRPAENIETANQIISTFPSMEISPEAEEPTSPTLSLTEPTEDTVGIITEATAAPISTAETAASEETQAAETQPVTEETQPAAAETTPAATEAPGSGSTDTSGGEEAITLAGIKVPPMQWNGVSRLCQQDARWAQQRYSRNTMSGGGCGPVSLSRALTYATGTEIMPMDLVDMKDSYGRVYRFASGIGTDNTLFPGWAAQFDVEVRMVQNCNLARYEMEKRNAVAICKLSGGAVSQNGHYVLLLEMKDDSCLIMDPTLEGINKYPDGVVSNTAVTAHCSAYNLIYPKGTEVPEESELKEMAKGLSFQAADYAEDFQKLENR